MREGLSRDLKTKPCAIWEENVPGRGNNICKGPEGAVCLRRVRRQRRGRGSRGRGEKGGESESPGDQTIWRAVILNFRLELKIINS